MERNCGNRTERGREVSRQSISRNNGADTQPQQREWRGGRLGSIKASRSGAILAALGLLFMGYGASRGEMPVVLEKAINICMECIGIG